PAHDVRIPAQPALPERVAQHRDEVCTDGLVICRSEQPTAMWLEPERSEVGARDHHALAVQRLTVIGDVRAEQSMRRQTAESGLRLLEVAEHWIAEDHVTVAGVVAGRRSCLRTWRCQVRESLRL